MYVNATLPLTLRVRAQAHATTTRVTTDKGATLDMAWSGISIIPYDSDDQRIVERSDSDKFGISLTRRHPATRTNLTSVCSAFWYEPPAESAGDGAEQLGYYRGECTAPDVGLAGMWTLGVTLGSDTKPFHTERVHMQCAKGYYEDDKTECVLCPDGVVCDSVGEALVALALEDGYWRSSTASDDFQSCGLGSKVQAGCAGGSNTSRYCKRGYVGPRCATCDSGFFSSWVERTCGACDEAGSYKTTLILLCTFAGITLLVMAVAYFLAHNPTGQEIRKRAGDGARRASVSLNPRRPQRRIATTGGQASLGQAEQATHLHHETALNHVKRIVDFSTTKQYILLVSAQVLYEFSGATGMSSSYPYPASGFVNSLSVFGLELLSLVPPECIQSDWTFYDKLLFKTLSPFAVVFAFACFHAYVQPTRDIAVVKAIGWSTMFLELVLPTIASTISETFVCEKFDAPDGARLRVQLTLACDATDLSATDDDLAMRASMKIYAGLMMAIYPFGVPLLLLAVLFYHRGDITRTMRIVKKGDLKNGVPPLSLSALAKQRGDPLQLVLKDKEGDGKRFKVPGSVMTLAHHFEDLDPTTWWFWIFLLVVRLMQTSMLTFFERVSVQAALGTVLCVVSLEIQHIYQPFRSPSDDRLGIAVTWCLLVWMFGLMMIESGVVSLFNKHLVGTFMVLTACGACIYAIWLANVDVVSSRGQTSRGADRLLETEELSFRSAIAASRRRVTKRISKRLSMVSPLRPSAKDSVNGPIQSRPSSLSRNSANLGSDVDEDEKSFSDDSADENSMARVGNFRREMDDPVVLSSSRNLIGWDDPGSETRLPVGVEHEEKDPEADEEDDTHTVAFSATLSALSVDQFDGRVREEYTAGVAAGLGVPHDSVRVTGVRTGSVVVETSIVVDGGAEAAAEIASVVAEPEAAGLRSLVDEAKFGVCSVSDVKVEPPRRRRQMVGVQKEWAVLRLMDADNKAVHYSNRK